MYDETFEKKSLPPEFKDCAVQHFIFNEVPAGYSLKSGAAFPRFGMPGGGTKYFVKFNRQAVSIADLAAKKIISKVEVVARTSQNSDVLTKTNEYFFLMDKRRVQFINGKFIYQNQEIQFSDAYDKGSLAVVVFSGQEQRQCPLRARLGFAKKVPQTWRSGKKRRRNSRSPKDSFR